MEWVKIETSLTKKSADLDTDTRPLGHLDADRDGHVFAVPFETSQPEDGVHRCQVSGTDLGTCGIF